MELSSYRGEQIVITMGTNSALSEATPMHIMTQSVCAAAFRAADNDCRTRAIPSGKHAHLHNDHCATKSRKG